jgi:diguanylate cyclase (GGDEF)-like protein
VYRYGGEELLLLLPETSSEGAYTMGQRLISGIVELGIPHERHPLKILTLSGGTSGPDETADTETWLHVVHRADYALYEAKNQGRNRIAPLYSSSLLSEPTPVSV